MRLDKFLVECGVGSRTTVKGILKDGRVLVNDQPEKSPKRHIEETKDRVQLDGVDLAYEKFVYYLLNKPKGVLSATKDARKQTVLDLLDQAARQKDVFPVGRLDQDTHGLLLLTNNGALAHALLSPKKHVSKVYRAKVQGIMTVEDQECFERGISLKDFTTLPAHLQILEIDEVSETSLVEITVAEGKYHQVKRMVAACGKEVLDLQRLSMGPLTLDESLQLGEYRRLHSQELSALAGIGVEL
ncbi:pseudouridine synthase [Streptococcus sp. DD13]|uniref:pseudouridine synthase n=1 Tax=Streptococcus sp. DD13 TaxID=1777881 RepID=UPI000794FE41|nr:pseudouridine synthase [Streptococcus sp. DD13]KXT77575.1 Ribosomal small subunit pseudouridine synthase A [Streptococcus sp. DD13]